MLIKSIAAKPNDPIVNHIVSINLRLITIQRIIQHSVNIRNMTNVTFKDRKKNKKINISKIIKSHF